jgi:streptogramin lyase
MGNSGFKGVSWRLTWTVLLGGCLLARPATAQPFVQEFPVPNANPGLEVIAAGPDGNLWFAEQFSDKIGRITPAGVVTEFPVSMSSFLPFGIAAGPDGNLWFTGSATNRIGRITPAGIVTEFPIPTPDSRPFGIAAGPDGNVWFTEQVGNKIGRITPAGLITEFPIPTPGSVPFFITTGPDGNLWFTENNGNRIGRITPLGAVTEFPAPTPGSAPRGIAAGPDGNIWFVERGADQIGRFTPAFLAISPGTGILATTQGFDLVLTIDTAGLGVVGGVALFDGMDIGVALVPCLVFGTEPTGGQTVRCPGLTAGVLGTGFHTMTVTLSLSDGSTVSDTVTWHVRPNTEP